MKKNRWFLRMLALLALSGVMMTTASLAAEAGTAQDPLVTLSYLNDTFLNTVLQQVDLRIAERNGQAFPPAVPAPAPAPAPGDWTDEGTVSGTGTDASAAFAVVTLTQGQVLAGGIGCEVMLRVGGASCVSPSSPGLIDETTAGILESGGALSQNHLYMMTIEGRGVQATAATTKLMVRGSYTVT